MTDILTPEILETIDIESLLPEKLPGLLKALMALYDQLDKEEPEDTDTPEYAAWLETMVDLEDRIDETRDRLDEHT